MRALLLLAVLGAPTLIAAQQFTYTVTWDPAAVGEQCQSATSASDFTYGGTMDVLYAIGDSGAAQGTIGAGVDISKGSFTFNYTYLEGFPTLNISACCLSPSYQGGIKFRCCCSGGNIQVSPATFTNPASTPLATCPSDVSLTFVRIGSPGQYIWTYDSSGRLCSGCAAGTTWDIPSSTCRSPAPSPPPPASGNRYTVTWDAAAVATQCQAASASQNYTYGGQLDILYQLGLAGALQGTLKASQDISSGSYSFDFTFPAGFTSVNISACCISPSFLGGAKFRCIGGNSIVTVSPSTISESSSPSPPPPPPATSTNGQCGMGLGSCGGDCCSQYGWCGTTPSHCSTGCQASFGRCDTSPPTPGPSPPPSGSLPLSTDGSCGAGRSTCGSSCCSQYGYCGTTPGHCGVGCQSGFGRCDSSPTPSPPPSGSLPLSTDGSCGAGRATCGSSCCSQYGYCGTTPGHCGAGCQSGFGRCN